MTCKCTSDAEAVAQGAGWCDEARATCMAGSDPAGACLGAITCNTVTPTCAVGQVPLVKDGCYTGECREIAVCEAAPTCGSLQHEDDCLGRTADCDEVKTGHGCTGTCPGTDCVCTSYTYASCADKGAAANLLILEEN